MDDIVKLLSSNPMYLGGAVGAVVVLVALVFMMRKKSGPAAQAPASGPRSVGPNIAAKEQLEKIPAGMSSAAAGLKKHSSQTLDTKIGQTAAPSKAARPAFEDIPPDPRLVTQYQEGTGEGIEALEERLKEDPNNTELLDWLAFMYYTQKQFDRAIKSYDKLINLGANSEHQHYYLGNSYYQVGNYPRAIEHWEMVEAMGADSKLALSARERRLKLQDMIQKGAL